MLFRLRQDFFYKKVGCITKGAAYTYMMLCEVSVSIVMTIVNLAPLCILTCFHACFCFFPSLISGLLFNICGLKICTGLTIDTLVSKLITI